MRQLRWIGWGALGMAALTACGNGTRGSTSGPGPVTLLSKTQGASGDGQSATAGSQLAQPIRVQLTVDNVPKAGVEIAFHVALGNGSVTAVDTTDFNGVAVATWTLGTTSGAQTVDAVLGGATGSPVSFGATALPGPPTTFVRLSGDNQTGVTLLQFATPLKVRINDQYGNPVSGLVVVWTGTGVTVDPTDTTDGKGEAITHATAGGVAGVETVDAEVIGVSAATTFHLTVIDPDLRISAGNIFFRSQVNLSQDPAVDTVTAPAVVLWEPLAGSHQVRSLGTPSFQSEPNPLNGAGYVVTFSTPGTYQYDCSIHGAAQMSGRVVVQ